MALDRQRDKKSHDDPTLTDQHPEAKMNRSPSRNNQTSLCGVTHLKPEACQTPRTHHHGRLLPRYQVSRAAKRTGRLSSLGKCSKKEPQAAYRDKIRVIDSFIRPCIYYAMVWAPSGRNEPSNRQNAGKATQAGIAPPRHIHWTPESMCATDLLHMDTGARPRSDNEAAHLRLYHRILSKDGAVTRKVMESLPADHPWMRRVHNAGAVVCPHAPTADLSKAAA
jgi:hypothetical protein